MISDERSREIISSSINNAICIDDEFCAPYESGDGNIEIPKALCASFRNSHACNLDVFHFSNKDDLESNLTTLFKNRDLLIVDWELSPNATIKYQDTLAIIENGVLSKSLRYIVIYTQSPSIEDIIKSILLYFSKYRKEFNELEERIIEALDEFSEKKSIEDDGDKIWAMLKDGVAGLSLHPEKGKEIRKSIDQQLSTKMPPRVKGELCKLIAQLAKEEDFKGIDDAMHWLDLNVQNTTNNYSRNIYDISLLTPHAVHIDNTIIVVLQKNASAQGNVIPNAVAPEDVFDKIVESVSKVKNLRTFIFSILLKNVMNDEIAQWGKHLGNISERALVYHAKSYEDTDEFIEYFSNCTTGLLKSSMLSSIGKQDIHELFKSDGIDDKPTDQDLCNLNCFLTFTDKKQLEDMHTIQTGDIFILSNPYHPEDSGEEYLICITQSCDCKRPRKIYHNYVFLHGHKANLKRALTETEKECYSFISSEQAIEWTHRFFSIHIESQRRFYTNRPIRVVLNNGRNNEMLFLGNQKIEFTQRLINYAFSHAQRMGIDLPHYPYENV